jgi:hypothetical protein
MIRTITGRHIILYARALKREPIRLPESVSGPSPIKIAVCIDILVGICICAVYFLVR